MWLGMDEDPEPQAIVSVNEILSKLPRDVAERVLRWAVDKYGIQTPRKTRPEAPGSAGEDGLTDSEQFKDLASFFAAASPTTETSKALTASFWLQEVEG